MPSHLAQQAGHTLSVFAAAAPSTSGALRWSWLAALSMRLARFPPLRLPPPLPLVQMVGLQLHHIALRCAAAYVSAVAGCCRMNALSTMRAPCAW